MTLQDEINVIKDKIADIEFKLVEQEKIKCRRKPDIGKRYLYICASGRFYHDLWDDDSVDNYRYNEKNVFKNKEEAQAVLNAKQAIHKIIDGWMPDWSDFKQQKYFNWHSVNVKKWGTSFILSTQDVNKYYYPTKKKAMKAKQYEEVLRKAGF